MNRNSENDSSSVPAKRSVSFGQSDDGMETVSVRSIPSRDEYSQQEIKKMWYTDCEFQIMKLSIIHTLKKVIAGTYAHEVDALESEARGLENKTPKGSAARKKNRYASLYAVLDEQSRQRESGQSTDSEYIAELYRQSATHCQAQAIKTAAKDFEVVQEKEYQPKVLPKTMQPPASPRSSRTAMARTLTSPLVKSRSRRRLLSMMIGK